MSHRGTNTNPNTTQIWDGGKWVEGNPRLRGVQPFPVAIANGSDFIWTGAPGGFGNLFLSAFVPTGDTEMTQAVGWATQTPGGGGGGALGIYNSAGLRLRNTAILPHASPGIFGAAWASGGELILTGGTLYFAAFYSNMNGAAYLRFGPAATPPAGSTVGFSVPNSGSLDVSGFPLNVSGFFGNLTALRFWSAMGE